MRNLEEIKKENIQKEVISEIRKAKNEILATMNITEEQLSPLPVKYFSLLNRKNKQGVKIKRIVFGSVKQYKYFLKGVKEKKLFFSGKHTKSKNYKRMIIIDGNKLFFKKKIKDKSKFYFTTNNKYLKEYKTYFNKFN
ncbi:MAG: hypothetical protein AAB595_02275 [Patescibacteria group bacterium]